MRVLVAEDNPVVGPAVGERLEQAGHKVCVVTDGSAAINSIRQGWDPDAVVLDLMMQGMGGRTFLNQLERLRPSTPVILATAASDCDLEDVKDRVWRVLRKSYNLEELVALLNQLEHSVLGV